jgi:uncharacterized alpha-E superfamily protein
VISRVADHCFWFGRYVERAEASARMLTASHNLALDAELDPAQTWRPVIVVSGEEAQFRDRFTGSPVATDAMAQNQILSRTPTLSLVELTELAAQALALAEAQAASEDAVKNQAAARGAAQVQSMAGMTQSMAGMTQSMAGMTQAMAGMTQAPATPAPDAPPPAPSAGGHPAWGDGELVERFMTWDEDNGVSIKRSILGARWNARQIREVISIEAWETINELHLWINGDAAATEWRDHRWAFYRHVRQMTQLELGLLRSTMLHDEPLDFVWLGVLLERVSQTARILDVHHHAFTRLPERHVVVETSLWLSLLRALGGYEPYMKRHSGRVSPASVAGFLLGEVRFPRSIAYCIHSAHERLNALRPPTERDLPGGQTLERLRVLDGWVAARRNEPLGADSVHELLTHVVDETHAICESLGRELLGHAA